MKKGLLIGLCVAVAVIGVVGIAVGLTILVVPPSTYEEYASYQTADGAYTVSVMAAGEVNSANEETIYVKIFCRENSSGSEKLTFERSCVFEAGDRAGYFEFSEREGGVTVSVNDKNSPTRKTILFKELF